MTRAPGFAAVAFAVAAAFAVLSALPTAGQAAVQAASGARPRPDLDVVLIVVDTLRADHVGCFGYARPTTPHIDALAAQGVRFARAFSQSSWTGPSMVSLFQSRHVLSEFVRMPEGPTLAERLHAAGYRTAGFQYNPMLGPGNGFERGFDSYEMTADPGRYREVLGQPDGTPDAAPLFAYFHFIDPHDPYSPVPTYDVFPSERDADLHDRLLAYLRAVRPDLPEGKLQARAAKAADAAARQVALYDGDVLQADQRVGIVMEALKQSGRLERSLVILAADHGECLGDHQQSPATPHDKEQANLLWVFKMTHGQLVTEELLHVPLIVAGPGVPAGVVAMQPVENVDIVPTVLELLGLRLPEGIDGLSLGPQMHGTAGGHEFTCANTALLSSVRAHDGRKLVLPWSADGDEAARAYRLADDPRERRPLAPDDPAFADLRAALDELRSRGLKARPEEVLIDAETQARLEQMGYVGR